MTEAEEPLQPPAPGADMPVRIPIGAHAELDAAVLMLLGATRRELRCAASDLSAFGLASRTVTELLRALLLADRAHSVQLLADDAGWIEAHAPRLKLLQRQFPHSLLIRVADRDDAVGAERVMIGDDRHALVLLEAPIAHGELQLNHRAFAQPLLAAFVRRWDRAAHNLAVAPLGL